MSAYYRITGPTTGTNQFENVSAGDKPKRKHHWRGKKSGPAGVAEVSEYTGKAIKDGQAKAFIVAKASDGTWKAWPV